MRSGRRRGALVRGVHLPQDLPSRDHFLRSGTKQVLFRCVERPPVHLRAGLTGAPRCTNGYLEDRRGSGALARAIMSFTCEEVWQYLPKLDSRAASVHLEQFPTAKDILGDARIPERDTKQQADWETLLAIREQVNKALDTARNEKLIGKSVDAQVHVTAAD